MNERIELNAAECLTCGERIESTYRHDYRCCGCPDETRVCVDGGHAYIRRVYGAKAKWRELPSGQELPEAISKSQLKREAVQRGEPMPGQVQKVIDTNTVKRYEQALQDIVNADDTSTLAGAVAIASAALRRE